MPRREWQRLWRLLGLAVIIGVLLGAACLLDFLPTQQAAATDVLFQRAVPPSSQITLVTMTGRSLQEVQGERPDPARAHAQIARLIDQLAAAGPRVIALDFVYEVETANDPLLAEAIGRAGNVLLAAVAADPRAPRELPAPLEYEVVETSAPIFTERAAGAGHVNVWPDRDGKVRTIPLVIQANGREWPALSLAAVARYLRRPAPLDGPYQDGYLRLAGRAIPVSPLYRFTVNYTGGPGTLDQGAFATLSVADVLAGTADPALLRDRLVLVGPWAPSLADECDTPRGRMYCVEIHAYAADTLLRALFLRPAPEALTVATILAFCLLVALLVWRLRPLFAGLAVLALGAAYFWAASEAFQAGMVLNLLYPPAALALAFVGLTSYQLVFAQARQRELRRALARYLSPAVAEEVARDPDRVDLGGELRTMTVLFSDIRGFTTLSERTAPRDLVALLNEYMRAMVAVLFREEGTLDKFMGDAIMAFWNAPKLQPDHAARACRTALAMVAELHRLRAEWEARGVPALDIGIGLNTGPMVFGNMGSELRTDFTVLGDSVNLGSRLEGLNKDYGTRIVVSESTRAAVGDAFAFRFLDLVAVKGKTEPVAIYELLAPAGALPAARLPVLAAYERGIAAYRAQDWAIAADAFADALAADPADGPSQLYLARAREYVANPPPPTWDGVYVATHK